MDGKWRYGNNRGQIYMSITEGRPKDQVWPLAAYVRKDAAPGRNDSLYPSEPESMRDRRN